MNQIRTKLLELREDAYRDFQCRLMPTVDPETVIGIRTPILRRFAASLPQEECDFFLTSLPHSYYEENNLHGILISKVKDPVRALDALEAFLPYVDNWATCDLIRPACFRQRPAQLNDAILRWLGSDHPYQIRFALEMLLVYYLKEGFEPSHLLWAASIQSGEYYVRMMVAWYFAEALAVRYEDAVSCLEKRKLDPWVHNKTIQKAVESFRVPAKRKEYLKSLWIKSSNKKANCS